MKTRQQSMTARSLSNEGAGAVRAVFLMPDEFAERAYSIGVSCGLNLTSIAVSSLAELQSACAQPFDLLLSFGTGVIVPKSIIHLPNITALNIHAASPEYPGRDPHHFAAYNVVREYGATLHYMTDKVDAGPIVDVELFDIPQDASAAFLFETANEAAIELMRRFFKGYESTGAPFPRKDILWGVNKSTRAKFMELCRIDCEMPETEFLRRLKATTMPGYNNLYIDIHGYRFRLEGKVK
jgi:methionyl-tRNA formyltransferase